MQLLQWLARFNRHVTTGWRPIIARVPFEQAVLLSKTYR
jgi:hypothetical protein